MKMILKFRKELDKYPKPDCWSCYDCCTAFQWAKPEKTQALKYMKSQGIKDYPKGKGDKFCEMLDTNWKCVIYPFRSIVCRSFWIWKPPMQCSKFPEYWIFDTLEQQSAINKRKDLKKNLHYDNFRESLTNEENTAIVAQTFYTAWKLLEAWKINEAQLKQGIKNSLAKEVERRKWELTDKNIDKVFSEVKELFEKTWQQKTQL